MNGPVRMPAEKEWSVQWQSLAKKNNRTIQNEAEKECPDISQCRPKRSDRPQSWSRPKRDDRPSNNDRRKRMTRPFTMPAEKSWSFQSQWRPNRNDGPVRMPAKRNDGSSNNHWRKKNDRTIHNDGRKRMTGHFTISGKPCPLCLIRKADCAIDSCNHRFSRIYIGCVSRNEPKNCPTCQRSFQEVLYLFKIEID